jgi:hypothetical protein
MNHMCIHSMGLMLAVARVISRGILARFPRWRAAFLEGNCSWAPRRISDGRVQTHFV